MDEENDSVDFDSPEFEAAIEEARNRGNGTAAEETPSDIVIEEKAPAPVVQPTTTDTTKPNYAEYLSTLTEGFIKDEDTLKSYIPKVKGYDDLETKLKDAESKIPQFKNPETEALFNLWANGDKKAVLDYIRETEKDYKTMSDVDVRREALQKDHPNWSKADVELEIRHKYGADLEKIDLSGIDRETDPDGYTEAVSHNKEVDKNLELLAVHARDDRYSLIEQQSKIELPLIKKAETPAATTQSTDAEIAEQTAKWLKNVEDNVPKISNIKMNIDDKEVEYVRSEDEKKELGEYMKTFNIFNFAKENGWYNEDGTPNSLKIAEDVHYLKNKENITKSFATQVKTQTTKEVIGKIKNTDDTYRAPEGTQAFESLEDAAWDAIDKARAKRKAAQD